MQRSISLRPIYKPKNVNMKKLLFIAVLTTGSATSFAQTTFGVQAGVNVASQNSKQSGLTLKTDPKTGFMIGAVAEVPFGSSINFRPELNFIQKGGKLDFSGSTAKLTLNYIELPLNFVYNTTAGSGTVFFGAGPSFGFGISGKEKSVQAGSPDVSVDVKFDGKKDATDDNDHLKAFDYGANILAGYKMSNGLFLKAGYTFGLANISPENGSKTRNNGLSFTVGYMFGGASSK